MLFSTNDWQENEGKEGEKVRSDGSTFKVNLTALEHKLLCLAVGIPIVVKGNGFLVQFTALVLFAKSDET